MPDLGKLLDIVASRIIAHAEELTALDSAIGDGDHGLNMKRGFDAVLADRANILAKPLPEALKAIGMTLVMKVGGASGPLYGTLFMALAKELPAEPSLQMAISFCDHPSGAFSVFDAREQEYVSLTVGPSKSDMDVSNPTAPLYQCYPAFLRERLECST